MIQTVNLFDDLLFLFGILEIRHRPVVYEATEAGNILAKLLNPFDALARDGVYKHITLARAEIGEQIPYAEKERNNHTSG